MENGNLIVFDDLPESIIIELPFNIELKTEELSYTCGLWDDERRIWNTEKCEFVSMIEAIGRIQCKCSNIGYFKYVIV